nr:MAG TPA: hypothetical protein [Siphoviridae sp. ct7JV2]
MNKYLFKSKEQTIMYNIILVNFNLTILFCIKILENSRFLYKNIEIKRWT